jgi:hypothetical protein
MRSVPDLLMRAVMTPVLTSMWLRDSDTDTANAGAAGFPALSVKVSAVAAGPIAWPVHLSEPSGQ